MIDLDDVITHQLEAEGHFKPAKTEPLSVRALYLIRFRNRLDRFCLHEFYDQVIEGMTTCTREKGHAEGHGSLAVAMEWDGTRYKIAAA